MGRYDSKIEGNSGGSRKVPPSCTCSGRCTLTCSGSCKWGCGTGCQGVCNLDNYKLILSDPEKSANSK